MSYFTINLGYEIRLDLVSKLIDDRLEPKDSNIRLETKSGRILPLTYVTKYDLT